MRDLADVRWMYVKVVLLGAIGVVSAGLLFLRQPSASTVMLIALVVWAFARVYYFAFYVIERYIDPSFRFSGLLSVVRFLWGRRLHYPRR